MSFGKRGNTDPDRPRPTRPQMVAAGGASDAGSENGPFIALVAAVVVISAALAFFAPSAMALLGSGFSSAPRPLSEVVANMPRAQAMEALKTEALPDRHGRAFLAALERSYPHAHDDLLGAYADLAQYGGTRDDLVIATNEWSAEFVIARLPEIARTGAEGYDFMLDSVDLGIDMIGQIGPNSCNLPTLVRYAEDFQDDPAALQSAIAYGSDLYKANMQYAAQFTQLAADGAGRPKPSLEPLTPGDQDALEGVVMKFMREPWVLELQMVAMKSGAIPKANQVPDINVCRISRSLVKNFRRIPDGTKGRIMSYAANFLDGLSMRQLEGLLTQHGASDFSGFGLR